MSKNDYFVIAYQLLKYLYNCLRTGDKINFDVINPDLFNIELTYWNYVISNLYADGYIEGVSLIPIVRPLEKGVKISPNLRITPKGIQHLEENSAFNKARGFIKDIAGIIPI
jgi:hypothetical protein